MQRIYSVTQRAMKRYIDSHASEWAASIAFFTLLGLPALFSISLWFLSTVDSTGQQDGVWQLLQEAVPNPQAQNILQSFMDMQQRTQGGGLVSVFAIIIALYAASSIFTHLSIALTELWQLPQKQKEGSAVKRFFAGRLQSVILVVFLGAVLMFVVLLGAIASALAPVLSTWLSIPALVVQIGALLLFICVVAVVSSGVFYMFARQVYSVIHIGLAGALTALLLALGQLVLALYFHFSDVSAGYGVIGSVVVLLVWLYYSTSIFLFGASFLSGFGKERS